MKHLACTVLLTTLLAAEAAAAQGINGWVTDHYLATYVGPSNTGSAHLPAFVRVSVDENQIAVVGWDIKTPERDEGLLSMLLSTTWESPMEPWQGSDEWFFSSYQMPMSDGSDWYLWYRRTGAGPSRFQLGAPPFVSPEQLPTYTITDQLQREWSFTQPFLVIPERSSFVLAAIGLLGIAYHHRTNQLFGGRDS